MRVLLALLWTPSIRCYSQPYRAHCRSKEHSESCWGGSGSMTWQWLRSRKQTGGNCIPIEIPWPIPSRTRTRMRSTERRTKQVRTRSRQQKPTPNRPSLQDSLPHQLDLSFLQSPEHSAAVEWNIECYWTQSLILNLIVKMLLTLLVIKLVAQNRYILSLGDWEGLAERLQLSRYSHQNSRLHTGAHINVVSLNY